MFAPAFFLMGRWGFALLNPPYEASFHFFFFPGFALGSAETSCGSKPI